MIVSSSSFPSWVGCASCWLPHQLQGSFILSRRLPATSPQILGVWAQLQPWAPGPQMHGVVRMATGASLPGKSLVQPPFPMRRRTWGEEPGSPMAAPASLVFRVQAPLHLGRDSGRRGRHSVARQQEHFGERAQGLSAPQPLPPHPQECWSSRLWRMPC